MRHSNVLIPILFASSLLAVEQKIEVIAKVVDSDTNITTATGTAVAVGSGYYVKADKIIYDKTNDSVEAFGNVYALKDSSSYIMSEHSKISLCDKTALFDKFFMQNQIDDVWVSSKNATAKKRFYDVNNSITSSCSVDSPDWQIKYKSGTYDTEEKQMRLSSATFYFGETPIFYSPYLSFSTDKTRRSGLLKPEFGFKGDEGIVYAQPIYYVTTPTSNWDSETIPQWRTNRGIGVFETLRFMDSPYSKGNLTLGYFKDKDSFVKDYSLKYDSHYGFSLLYDRKRVFADLVKGEQDGLYADIAYLNDIDYKNLQDFNKNGIKQNIDAIATSKVNYFFQKDANYFGSYLRYYVDTSKSSNDDTLQQLPKLHYHRYLETLFGDRLIYSADSKITRYDRKTGLRANQYQLFTPFTLNFSLFDDYLGLSASENLYMNRVSFSNSSTEAFQDYSYSSNVHKLKTYTSLLKKYDGFIHTLSVDAEYVKPGVNQVKNYPDPTKDSTASGIVSQVTSSDEVENVSIKLVQFFYDNSGKQFLFHRINQMMYVDGKKVDNKYADMENEVQAKITDNVTLSSDVFYSYKNSQISKSTTTIKYEDDEGHVSLSQTYKNISQELPVVFREKANYLSLGFEKKFAYRYYVVGNYDFDYHLSQERSWLIGLGMKKKCFAYQFSLKNETTPILTTNNQSSSVKNLVVYMSVNFIPIGGINQVYSVK